MKIYQVGGAVRDKLMNRSPQDIDYVVVSSTPEEMLNKGFKQVGKNFPVFINPTNKCEYALARKEVKTGNKHTDFKFIFDESVSLEEDLMRRDFTCNAIALDEETSQIIDPFNGANDIKNKILKHINSKHFIEDPLRILRMCRFAAQLNFDIAPETFLLAKQMVSDGLLKYLSPERIWQEILKAFQTNNFELFITAAQQCGALQQILPEIVSLFSIPENIEKHPEETVGAHTILALKEVSQSKPIVKFAVLVHDIGKIKTPKENISTYDDHALNGIDIINQICNRLRIPNTYKKFAILCCQYHTLFSKIKKLDSNTLIEFADRFVKCEINDFIEVCKANYFGRLLKYDKEEFQENVEMFKLIVETLKKIKASNIPNFNNIKKDKNIANELHKLKIDTINNLLKK